MTDKKRDNSHITGGRFAAAKKITLFLALSALGASLYTLVPDSNAVAQNEHAAAIEEQPRPVEAATQAMIDFAVGALKSASEYTVYAERGITERGNADIRGTKLDARRSAESRKSTKELSNSIDAFRQLPCTELKGGDLTGRTFAPGVYCLNSAELNGEMVLDGAGNAAGTYIFRVAGSLNAKNGSSIRLENGAQGGNVFFVAGDVEIGNDVAFRANVLSGGNVKIGDGSSVTDKVMSLGKVELNDSALLGGTTGTIQICAQQSLPVAPANDISNRVFHYVVTGAAGSVGTAANPVRVAIGACSGPIDVTAGPQTVTELNTGGLLNPPTGSFEGNFELVDVANLTPASPSSLGLINLATRAASVNVVAGGEVDQLILRFTNRRTITGFVEICHRASTGPRQHNPATGPLSGGDPDVTGFFQYTIEDVYSVNQQNPNVKTLQVFTIPVGQCTGPIAVKKGDPAPFGPDPMVTTATVSMIPRAGAYLESFNVTPPERQNGPDVKGTIIGVNPTGDDVVIPAPGGGYVDVIYPASTSTDSRTVVLSRARSNPSRVKVCKVAGPGIPIDTLFRFTVTGTGTLNAAHPQAADYGHVTRTVDVRAGDPAQGGTCEFVPGFGANPQAWAPFQTFVNGTPVTIVEDGISPANTVAQNPGQLRTANIRTLGAAFASTDIAGFSPNPDLTPAAGRVSRAVVTARSTIVEVEFTGFRFNPTVLKVCKIGIAGPTGNPVGAAFNFAVNLVSPQIGGANPGPMFPPFSQAVSVTAGPAGTQEGNCMFVNGSALLGGAFNQGSTITITEADDPNTRLTEIRCPTCGPGGFTANLETQQARLSGPSGLIPGINSVVFTNTHSPVCRSAGHLGPDEKGGSEAAVSSPSCSRATRFDFDGDRKADPSVFTPSTGVWSVMMSGSSNNILTRGFGISGDRPVAADYDGDGITDFAVWRPSNGRWYFQGSMNIFEYQQWGVAGDIPLTGDYNGDGRADFFIFRPSNATWYIRTTSGQITIFQFGIPTDKVFTADFDNDGRTDVAVFRNGTWYILESTRGFRVIQFGQTSDIPVPGDYDGDGAADLGIFRNGTWYVLTTTSYTVRQNGMQGDIPVPADYDGDGKYDLAVFRASEGRWVIRRSAFGEPSPNPIILGGPGDIAIPSPYWLLPGS